MAVDIEAVANSMFKMISEGAGVKRYKPGDLTKAMLIEFEADEITKKDCKGAIRILVDNEQNEIPYSCR